MRLISGVRAGHWTDHAAATGVTVVVLPPDTTVSGEIRGGAPATREFGLLGPEMLVRAVDAVVMTGGSAFGLAAADGVMAWLDAQGRGFLTRHGRVPIVVAMALYDLGTGSPGVHPGPAHGEAACGALSDRLETGRIGAGAGATYHKHTGADAARPGGLVAAETSGGQPPVSVQAIVAVNAFGGLAGPGPPREVFVPETGTDLDAGANTTLATVLTDAALDKTGCHVVAQGAHDGVARAIDPAHTRFDGDAVVVAATGTVPADVDLVRSLAANAVEMAVRQVDSLRVS